MFGHLPNSRLCLSFTLKTGSLHGLLTWVLISVIMSLHFTCSARPITDYLGGGGLGGGGGGSGGGGLGGGGGGGLQSKSQTKY